MKKNKKIIAIIPARGGSKRLPGKNIKILAGKPLIAHTIEWALKSKYIDRTIISTDDDKIAEISMKYGGEVIKRPKYIARDTTKMVDVLFHSLKALEKERYIPEIVVLLQPTSPLRTTRDVNKAVEIFLKNKNNCELVISVSESKPSPYWSLKMEGKYLKPFLNQSYFSKRDQDLPTTYIPNGAIYVTTPKILKKYQALYSFKILPYFMPEERSIDIDKEIDFKLAELTIKSNK